MVSPVSLLKMQYPFFKRKHKSLRPITFLLHCSSSWTSSATVASKRCYLKKECCTCVCPLSFRLVLLLFWCVHVCVCVWDSYSPCLHPPHILICSFIWWRGCFFMQLFRVAFSLNLHLCKMSIKNKIQIFLLVCIPVETKQQIEHTLIICLTNHLSFTAPHCISWHDKVKPWQENLQFRYSKSISLWSVLYLLAQMQPKKTHIDLKKNCFSVFCLVLHWKKKKI